MSDAAPDGGLSVSPSAVHQTRSEERFRALDDELHAVISWFDAASGPHVPHADTRLAGLLLGLKDNIDVAGSRSTAGSGIFADSIAERDADVVEALTAAGATVIAKLNLAELALGSTSENSMFGGVRNPWNPERTAGGSSGGSAAALAARYCDIALGTDTGASARLPAAVNGVVGLRPTIGSISTRGVRALSRTFDTVSPMARDVALVAAMTDVLQRRPAPIPSRQREDAMAGLRVGLPTHFFFDDLDAGVARRVDDFIHFLRSRGARITEVPDFGQARAERSWRTIVEAESAHEYAAYIADSSSPLDESTRSRLARGLALDATDVDRARGEHDAFSRRAAAIFDDVDILVAPLLASDIPPASTSDPKMLKGLTDRSIPWALHHGPTLALPIGFHPTSALPVGISLVAAAHMEADLFHVGKLYQRETRWHEHVPRLVRAAARRSTVL